MASRVRKNFDQQIIAGNTARDEKYDRLMGIKAREAGASEVTAQAAATRATADVMNASTNQARAAEDTRHNYETESAVRQGLTNDATRNKQTYDVNVEQNRLTSVKNANDYETDKEKNRISAASADSSARLQAQQGIEAGASARRNAALAASEENNLALQKEYVDPATTPARRAAIQGMFQLDKASGGSSMKVLPGQKISTFGPSGTSESLTPPQIINPDGTSTDVLPSSQVDRLLYFAKKYEATDPELSAKYMDQYKSALGNIRQGIK